jgi:hypothetical protein
MSYGVRGMEKKLLFSNRYEKDMDLFDDLPDDMPELSDIDDAKVPTLDDFYEYMNKKRRCVPKKELQIKISSLKRYRNYLKTTKSMQIYPSSMQDISQTSILITLTTADISRSCWQSYLSLQMIFPFLMVIKLILICYSALPTTRTMFT